MKFALLGLVILATLTGCGDIEWFPSTATAIVITTTALPAGTLNQAYSATLTASGGTQPYRWTQTGLPTTLTLDPSTGAISGTPTAAANASITVTVTDASTPALTTSKAFTLTIS